MVPSPRCRSAGLLVDPCGGEFTHLQSLAPHAAAANRQNCQLAETKDALQWLVILYDLQSDHSVLQIKEGRFNQQQC